MSERLIAQQQNMNSECDSLRAQLAAAEHRAYELSEKCQLLENQMIQAMSSNQPLSLAIPSPAQTGVGSELPSRIPEHQFTSRILRPTFSLRPTTRDLTASAMSSAWELWGDDTGRSHALPDADAQGCDSETYVSLSNAFFDKRWPYLPVIHRQTFFEDHLAPFLAGPSSSGNPLTNFIVNMVCAIASTESSCLDNGNQNHRNFFKLAVRDLCHVMSSETFECIQCLLLLCMYGHNEPQLVNMWYTTGLALNLAIGIDLHRREALHGQSTKMAELFKRIFWCAYVMNCSVAINMGRPLGIQQSDISMPLPLQMTDNQLSESVVSPGIGETSMPNVTDTSTFIHIIKLRLINAAVYTTFHPIASSSTEIHDLEQLRTEYYMKLNQWLITAPRYIQTVSTFQSTEWFQIAFHHAVLTLHRPSRAVPIPSPDALRVCADSAIGLISSYSALYARNRIKYTFVAIHSLFMAAVTMLYSLRAFGPLRRELSKPVIQTNILTFLTLFRGICDGRPVGEKCCTIIERLGNSILLLVENEDQADLNIDTEFQTWFGLRTHTFPPHADSESDMVAPVSPSQFPDIEADLPWADLFTEGINLSTADVWSVLF